MQGMTLPAITAAEKCILPHNIVSHMSVKSRSRSTYMLLKYAKDNFNATFDTDITAAEKYTLPHRIMIKSLECGM